MTDGIMREANASLLIEEAMTLAESDPIWAIRGKAIQSYALLEQALSGMLANLEDMARETAQTIFYKIINTGSRNGILEKLLHRKHGTKFNLFWNSFVKELRILDLKRNEIVHWLSAVNTTYNDKRMLLVGVTLIPPASLGDAPTQQMTSSDLIAFAIKCEIFARLCGMFDVMTGEKRPKELDPAYVQTWLDIFQQPLVYPLPAGHPLFPAPKAPDTPPPPSPA